VGKKPSRWTFEEAHRNVHVVRMQMTGPKWEQWVLLMSDEHWDNPMCRRDLLLADHKEAVARDAPILSFGDTFCVMQGKWDKRSSKDDVLPEHQSGNYLDSLVSTAADWYRPFGSHKVLLGRGNHEQSILKHHETDLTERLAERLRGYGAITRAGGYGGWVRFLFYRGNASRSVRLYYHHGFGGGGPVTKGTIDFNRYAEQISEAEIIVSGHIHRQQAVEIQRQRLTDGNKVETTPVTYIRTATYKDEFRDGHSGYHNEGGRGPRPLGGYWLRFYRSGSDGQRVCWQTIKTES
jgi:hypothetical protein